MRGKCPVCGKWVKLKRNGKVRAHKIFGVDCHGSRVEN